MTKRQKPDPEIFAETPRDQATLPDMEAAMRQVMNHPAKPVSKSKNREPAQAELNQRWKLVQRA